MAKPCGKAAYTRMDEMTAEDFAVLQSYKNAYPPDPAALALDMLAGFALAGLLRAVPAMTARQT